MSVLGLRSTISEDFICSLHQGLKKKMLKGDIPQPVILKSMRSCRL